MQDPLGANALPGLARRWEAYLRDVEDAGLKREQLDALFKRIAGDVDRAKRYPRRPTDPHLASAAPETRR